MIVIHTIIQCDYDNGTSMCCEEDRDGGTKKETIDRMKKNGWKITKDIQLCPKHKNLQKSLK